MQPEGSWISGFGVEEKITVTTEQTMPREGLFKSSFVMERLRNCSATWLFILKKTSTKILKSKCDSVALDVDHLTHYPSVPPVFVPFPNIRAGTSNRKSD